MSASAARIDHISRDYNLMGIFSILQTYYRSPMRRMHELEDHLIETWRKLLLERKLAKPDERPTLSKNIGMVQIGPDAR